MLQFRRTVQAASETSEKERHRMFRHQSAEDHRRLAAFSTAAAGGFAAPRPCPVDEDRTRERKAMFFFFPSQEK